MIERALLRPWRDGAFRLLALALLIAAFSLTAMGLLRAEINHRFDARTAEILGGQLILKGTRFPDSKQRALTAPLRSAETVTFATVVVNGDKVLLVSAKAVSDHWPLFGRVTVADKRFGSGRQLDHGPPTGQAWLAGQGLDRLGLHVGDKIQVGDKTLTLSAVLQREPDGGTGFYSMSPRLLMNRADLKATGVIAPGTRLHDRLLLAGPETELRQVRAALKGTLRADQKLEGVDDAAERTGGPLRQLTLWISLGVLLVALLCGAAIFLATGERVDRRSRQAALMRCFGASRRQVIRRLLGGEVAAVIPASLAGGGLGLLLVTIVRARLGWTQPMAAGPGTWALVLLAPLLLWAGFAVPRLLTLLNTPAAEVLRAGGGHRRPAMEFGAALAVPALLAVALTDSWRDLGLVLGLLVGLGALLPALLWPGLRWLERRSRRWRLPLRLALRRLSRRPVLTLPLLAALTLAIATLTLAGQTGTQLIHDWRARLPQKAPDYFVINLFDNDKPVLNRWLKKNGGKAQPFYPVVRGRLTGLNGKPVKQALTGDRDDHALERDLSLTQAANLPDSNRITAGHWWQKDTPPNRVSVEKDLANRLGLKVGDTVTFTTSRGKLTARIDSLRKVDWESFAPNFFFMFSPDSFHDQDITWLTSFWLPPGSGERLSHLVQQLPHITLLDVREILDRLQDIIARASAAAGLLAALLMASALLVLGAALLAGQAVRSRDNALLRTLGAGDALVRRVQLLEFLLLGAGAALAAELLVLAALWPLGQHLFHGVLPISLWELLPPAAALVVGLTGLFLSRASLRAPAVALLRSDV